MVRIQEGAIRDPSHGNTSLRDYLMCLKEMKLKRMSKNMKVNIFLCDYVTFKAKVYLHKMENLSCQKSRISQCDLVGMTAMPEAALAREAGLAYASLCLVANWGAGLTENLITMEEILQTISSGVEQIHRVMSDFVPQ